MQNAVMAAASSSSLNARQSCSVHGCRPLAKHAAAAASASSRPGVVCSWRPPATAGHAALQWRRRPQGQQLSSVGGVVITDDEGGEVVVDDRLHKNPCGFHPCIWGDFFLHHSNAAASSQQQTWIEQAGELKEVAAMIASSSTRSLLERLQLIDALGRLCINHLFEDEIDLMLTEINGADVSGCDLQTVALWFYLLRKHGHNVSPDVFSRFKDEEGNFAANTPIELLSLYTAAHFSVHGEAILDEAVLFTRKRLESTLALQSLDGSLEREIRYGLEMPLSRRVPIYEANYYITTYSKEATVHETVLRLAKLNFNLMQLQYQQELKIVTRWWKDLQVQSRLPFARDRIVECYLWMLGVYFEPRQSRGRIILTMVISIATIFDDIFDSYATQEECELFTKCVERWDRKGTEDLPECMEFILGKIFDSHEIIDGELAQEEKYRMPYLRNFTIDLVRNYNKEVKMREEKYVPKSVEEHLQVSQRTGACHLLACTSFVGMHGTTTKESLDWVSTMPKMVQGLCRVLRLVDDLETYEREQLTPHVASTIHSCMKQYDVPIETARQKIQELKEETWKDMNGEWLSPNNPHPKKLLDAIFNLTRTMEFIYNQADNFTYSNNLKDTVHALFVQAFTI